MLLEHSGRFIKGHAVRAFEFRYLSQALTTSLYLNIQEVFIE